MQSESISTKNSLVYNISKIKIYGISLPLYSLICFIVISAAISGILPTNMVGALALLMVLGGLFNFLGSNLPIVKTYLGGGAVFCIFASAALVTFNILPNDAIDNCSNFLNNVGFLDFYIAALITGSIFGMNRDLLIKSAIRFLPVSFISMACAILMVGTVAHFIGYGFSEAILYIALPMMSGGMGAGVIPLSGIYANATNIEASQFISRMVPASALGNVLAIMAAVMVAKIANSRPSWNGNGQLMKIDSNTTTKANETKPDFIAMGTGLLMAMTFFIIGMFINKIFPNVHAYAFMIIIVVILKASGIIHPKYEQAAVQWSQFVMKNLTSSLLVGIGIALLDLEVLAAAITPVYLLLCIVIILTVALCAGIGGKLVGFYPAESSITAGLCTNSMGGTGNIAVLSASNRMELIPFAQMATRLGGAVILITSSFLIQILA